MTTSIVLGILCHGVVQGQVLVEPENPHALDLRLELDQRRTSPDGSRVTNQGFRNRNLIITNNVIGGRGFRGTVGYTAEADFRGDMGSDDLFEFRSGSAWSDVNYINLSVTHQQFRFGQELGSAPLSPSASESLLRPTLGTGRWSLERAIRLDRLSAFGSSGNTVSSRYEPRAVGSLRGNDGVRYIINASEFSGIRSVPLGDEVGLLGLSSLDRLRIQEDTQAGRGSVRLGMRFLPMLEKPNGQFAVMTADGRELPALFNEQQGAGEGTPYRSLADRIAERFGRVDPIAADPVDPLQDLQERLDALREKLLEDWMETQANEPGAVEPAGGIEPGSQNEEDGKDGDQVPLPPLDPGVLSEGRRINLQAMAGLLRHGEPLDALSSPDDTRRFNEILSRAEQSLRDGRYFTAEGEFLRSLRFIPRHPLATLGLLQAQVGAGVHGSASITLRSLLSNHPELIGIRVDPAIMPSPGRLQVVTETLLTRMDGMVPVSGDALLLSWLGWVTGDVDRVLRGIDLMEQASPDDPLVPVLRIAWIDEGSPEEGGDSREVPQE